MDTQVRLCLCLVSLHFLSECWELAGDQVLCVLKVLQCCLYMDQRHKSNDLYYSSLLEKEQCIITCFTNVESGLVWISLYCTSCVCRHIAWSPDLYSLLSDLFVTPCTVLYLQHVLELLLPNNPPFIIV